MKKHLRQAFVEAGIVSLFGLGFICGFILGHVSGSEKQYDPWGWAFILVATAAIYLLCLAALIGLRCVQLWLYERIEI